MLMAHPAIVEAAVIGVPDAMWGETPKAYITIRADSSISGQDIIQWARNTSNISKFMVPREVEIIKALPKTSTGKIKKKELRNWATSRRKISANL
jgi:acyl-coenzyme A synthetase/AMP-(fatty) acid ligase